MSGYAPKFEAVPGYFVQDTQDPSTLPPIPRRFGLLDGKTWDDVTSNLTSLQSSATSGTSYILFFLGRHGQGYHNEGAEIHGHDWKGIWAKQEGDGKICWGPDAYLTHHGEQQAAKAHDAWKGERPFGVPVPDKMYCSPLTRALRTHEITFGDVESPTTVVLENCREEYGVWTCNKRRTRTYISLAFPSYQIEPNFTEDDELWKSDEAETFDHVKTRAKRVLYTAFTDKDSPQVVAITAHGGFIKAFMDVVGRSMKKDLPTAGVLPVIVKCTMESTSGGGGGGGGRSGGGRGGGYGGNSRYA